MASIEIRFKIRPHKTDDSKVVLKTSSNLKCLQSWLDEHGLEAETKTGKFYRIAIVDKAAFAAVHDMKVLPKGDDPSPIEGVTMAELQDVNPWGIFPLLQSKGIEILN